jgi:hypothetical protein
MAPETEAQMYRDRLINVVDRLIATMDELDADGINWKPPGDEMNSITVLATHVMGNVREIVVQQFGGAPLDRDRDAEFRAVGQSAEQLKAQWTELRAQVNGILSNLDPAILDQDFTRPRSGDVYSGRKLLMHATVHAAEHVGHAELTRDILKAG